MSVALTANMFSITPVYAADEFTDTEISAPEVSTDDDEVWSDGTEAVQSEQEFTSEAAADAGQEQVPPAIAGSKYKSGFFDSFLALSCDDSDYIQGITEIKVNDTVWEKKSWIQLKKEFYLMLPEMECLKKMISSQ